MKTTTKKRPNLSIQAEGINRINEYSIEILNKLLPELQKMIGQKILLSDGRTSKKFNIGQYADQPHKKEGDHFISCQYWFDFSRLIWLNVKVCISGGSYEDNTYYCQYIDKALYVGEIDGQTLKSVKGIEEIIKNSELEERYTEEELTKLIDSYNSARALSQDILSKIPQSVISTEHLNR